MNKTALFYSQLCIFSDLIAVFSLIIVLVKTTYNSTLENKSDEYVISNVQEKANVK